MKTIDCLYKLARCFLGGIFIYAGSTKLLEPETFAVLIQAYGLVPDGLLLPVALALPALEVVAGLGLLFDIRGSLAITAGLLVLFMAVLGYGLWLGLDIDCGCFGPEDPESRAFHGLDTVLYRDLVLLVGVAFMYGWRHFRGLKPVTVTIFINRLFWLRRKPK